eukprot:9215479-Pyramimonas_sp.AAC.1
MLSSVSKQPSYPGLDLSFAGQALPLAALADESQPLSAPLEALLGSCLREYVLNAVPGVGESAEEPPVAA